MKIFLLYIDRYYIVSLEILQFAQYATFALLLLAPSLEIVKAHHGIGQYVPLFLQKVTQYVIKVGLCDVKQLNSSCTNKIYLFFFLLLIFNNGFNND